MAASRVSAFNAPRTLNDRVTCSDSSLSRTSAEASVDNHGEWMSGVGGRCGASRRPAARMSSTGIIRPSMISSKCCASSLPPCRRS